MPRFLSNLTPESSAVFDAGGTSSQFLKGDGTLDSTTYQTELTNPVTGTGVSGRITYFNGTTTVTSSSNFTVSGNDLIITGNFQPSEGLWIKNTSNTVARGVSLYGGSNSPPTDPLYGMFFSGTATFGTYGPVTSDWATYFTMNTTANRGWIFKSASDPVGSSGNVFAINNAGAWESASNGTVNGTLTATGAVSGSNLSGTNTGDQTITLTGDVTGSGTGSFATTISANSVEPSMVQDYSGYSVLGNPNGTSATPIYITAGEDEVLRRDSSGSLVFGKIDTNHINDLVWSKITGTPTTLAGYGITDADNYSSWTLRDGDTTTVNVGSTEQINIIEGTGIDVNWTDTVGPIYGLTITNSSPNVTTNLSYTASTGTVNSSDGTNATIGAFPTTGTNLGLVPGSNSLGATYYLDGSGNWSQPGGGIGGSIADTQVAYGNGTDITGTSTFIYDDTQYRLDLIHNSTSQSGWPLRLFKRDSDGAGAANITVGIDFYVESTTSTDIQIGRLDVKAADAGATTKDTTWDFIGWVNNTQSTFMSLGGTHAASYVNTNTFGLVRDDGFGFHQVAGGTVNLTFQAPSITAGQINMSDYEAGLILPSKPSTGDPTASNGLIYYNTTDGKFRAYENGSWKDVITAAGSTEQHTKAVTVQYPNDSEDVTIFYTDTAITMDRITHVKRGGTSVTATLKYASTRSAAGTTFESITINSETGTSVADTTSIGADNWIWLETSAVSGTVDEINVTLEYHMT